MREAVVDCDDGIACTEDGCIDDPWDCTHTTPDVDADGQMTAGVEIHRLSEGEFVGAVKDCGQCQPPG